YAGRWEGIEAWRRFGALFLSIWQPEVAGPVELFPKGDRVAARFTLRLASRATGKRVDMPLVEIFTARDGRITELEVFYSDTARMLAALRA
ncbi:MAG TPA: nuclear transport factor 2 family protein, partial [Acetobacteraceae bacterium]|nr:nuclear transport factor 2 family protein [Acetobacteraceae bacterium]